MKNESLKGKTIREQILSLVTEYYKSEHIKPDYKLGDPIPYGGRVYDEKELQNLVSSSLDFWLTTGPWSDKFEADFCEFFGVKYCSLVNSGSSANLLAFMALTSHKLGEKRILPGDEVITVAAGFPTTVTPIIQYGAIPVFVDVTLPTYNIDVTQLEAAISPKTKAVMIAHTLGNPFDIKAVKNFCDKNDLWLIEDNCDALGSKYCMDGKWGYTGTFGDIATSSFYPPHHMTMGEGGAVYTNDPELHRIVNSMRDWGRDCWCPSGHDNTCGCRFTQQFGELPLGYDHKYVYSHFGYNLKVTDMQAAIGCAQLEKLPGFIEARQRNWQYLKDNLKDMDKYLILPEATENSSPSWFGFMMTVKKDAPFTRDQLVRHLEENKIQTRMLFAGNLTKHPCFDEMLNSGKGFRISGELINTDLIMNNSFWVGVYPGMVNIKLNEIIRHIKMGINK
jgi:CDP-6-deoxy-D-xylo-4-hexulose-3-dehydrase